MLVCCLHEVPILNAVHQVTLGEFELATPNLCSFIKRHFAGCYCLNQISPSVRRMNGIKMQELF